MSAFFPESYPTPQHNLPPKPLPFHMTDPFQDRGMWCFWLTADTPVLQFTSHLNCVLSLSYAAPAFFSKPQGRGLVAINPRYDAQEVWLWIYELLESETHWVELDNSWEDAIQMACEAPEEPDFF